MNLVQLREAGAELETLLRLQTYPIAVKMVKGEGYVGDGRVLAWILDEHPRLRHCMWQLPGEP